MNTIDENVSNLFRSCNNCMCKYVLPYSGYGCFIGVDCANQSFKFHQPIKSKDQIKDDLLHKN